MAEIPYDEETTRDWSWYAVDEDGLVAQFATGTFRRLPVSVRSDWERAEALIEYFERAEEIGGSTIRPEFQTSEIVASDPTTFGDQGKRGRYLNTFSEAARKGLFSYDTVLKVPGGYFGVTAPQNPLKLAMLPTEIQKELVKTKASVRFRQAVRIPEDVTLQW